MDEIDSKQQQEIETLKRVDVKHDERIIAVRWITWGLFIFVTAMFAITMMTLQKSSAYSCPHKECPHYTGRSHGGN
jgi:hypothetical protein